MSVGIILLIFTIIALLFFLKQKSEVIEKPLYRTQYVTEYIPVPVRRPYRRERFIPPRRIYPENIRPRHRWPPRRQHEQHEHHEHHKYHEHSPIKTNDFIDSS